MAKFYALANGAEGLKLLFEQIPLQRFSGKALEQAISTATCHVGQASSLAVH